MEIFYNSIELVKENAVIVGVGTIIILTAIFTTPSMHRWEWMDFIPKGRKNVDKRAREKQVNSLLVEDFVSAIEDRVHRGEITRAETKEVYRKLKQLFPIRDLYPAAHLLKEKIKRRLKKTEDYEAIPFPDKVNGKKRKLKHVFDKVKRVTL